MTETQLKTKVGLFLIISHIAIIMLVIILYLAGGFLFDEMTTTIALIVPMFSIYTTAIIKYIILNKTKTEVEAKQKSKEYTFISLFFPLLFVFFLIAIIVLKASNIGFSTFEQFKAMLAISETAFGSYIGLILYSFFEINLVK